MVFASQSRNHRVRAHIVQATVGVQGTPAIPAPRLVDQKVLQGYHDISHRRSEIREFRDVLPGPQAIHTGIEIESK